MTGFLETTVDKFTFKVATDRWYTAEGLWALLEGGRARIGLSDFMQQRSGDVAFAEVQPPGTALNAGDEIGTIETIKVDVVLSSPVSGTVIEVNPALADAPEVVNQDPYGAGWLAVVELTDWAADQANLLTPDAYFDLMKREAEEETKKI
jgi:glycine cleavage system H protein